MDYFSPFAGKVKFDEPIIKTADQLEVETLQDNITGLANLELKNIDQLKKMNTKEIYDNLVEVSESLDRLPKQIVNDLGLKSVNERINNHKKDL